MQKSLHSFFRAKPDGEPSFKKKKLDSGKAQATMPSNVGKKRITAEPNLAEKLDAASPLKFGVKRKHDDAESDKAMPSLVDSSQASMCSQDSTPPSQGSATHDGEKKSSLTPEQKARMEENKKKALALRGAKLNLQKDFYGHMEHAVEKSWAHVLRNEVKKGYFSKLKKFLQTEGKSKTVYPPRESTFNAFKYCPFDKVKVVILGQDPYINVGEAHGLCFSVQKGIKVPPSLANIYKELQSDFSGTSTPFTIPSHGYLEHWARQGILLLNTVLTVRARSSNSHRKQGWEEFTHAAIKAINDKKSGVVFLLWGKPAQEKGKLINKRKHHVLESAHPSPLSSYRGFFGCKHFTKCNEYLTKNSKPVIEWNLPDDTPLPVPVAPSQPVGKQEAPPAAAGQLYGGDFDDW